MKKYEKAVVSCKRVVCNPFASDEYKVTITPFDSESVTLYTLAGIFEPDEAICDRMYRQWLKEQRKA